MYNMQSYEQLSALNKILIQELQAIRLEVQQLKNEIQQLKEKLNTNSSNSSTPPSQDPYKPSTPKKPTGRKQGAQKGHRGHSRKLTSRDQVQTAHDLKPNICPNCQSNSFHREPVKTDFRQVVELPEAPPEVAQFNIHTYRCNCCGKHVKANVPDEAQYGFGPRLMGLITSFSGEFRLSKRQVSALMKQLGIQISSGSVCNIHARASQMLMQPYQEIKERTLQQEHLNADETSWKTLAKKRWIWIGSCEDSVFFEIKASRSTQAFQEAFGAFKGGLTTDRYSAYNSHEGVRQLCWSHADRDFEKIASRTGVDKWIGEQLLRQKERVFALWHSFKQGEITRNELIKQIEIEPKENIRVLLKAGARHDDCQNKTRATCIDFLNHFEMLWEFVYRENIEPTNNAAEQGLRHGVIWRKLCYGSQSETGEKFVERVMTVSMTLKKMARNSFDYFTNCFRAFIRGSPSPQVFSS